MKYRIFIILLLISFVSFSQSKDTNLVSNDSIETPYNPTGKYNYFSIKGPILITYFWTLYTPLSFEYGFCKRHSIGLELFYNKQWTSHDDAIDNNGVSHDVGNFGNIQTRAFFVSYRYYLNAQNIRKKGSAPYLTCFYRYGEVKTVNDLDYRNDYYYKFEKQNSIGIVYGVLVFGDSKFINKLGLDLNAGVFYKQKNTVLDYDEGSRNKTSNLGIRIGIYLNYNFTRKKAS